MLLKTLHTLSFQIRSVRLKWPFLISAYFIFVAFNSNAAQVIKIPHQISLTSDQNDYYFRLLNLALVKTKHKYGEYIVETTVNPIPQKRAVLMLEKNQRISLFWTMTSKEREKRLKAIPIPLVKGLLGHRIFVIRKEDLPVFSSITTLDQLRTLKVGQGHGWPDTRILQANDVKVTIGPDFDSLYPMLKAKRFDYFPRGINEPWGELKNLNDPSLVVEPRLMFRYKAPLYFFVNKQNDLLYKRIHEGLLIAIDDGSFDRLFNQESSFRENIERSNIEGRIIFDLDNPDVLDQSAFQNKSLWLNLN